VVQPPIPTAIEQVDAMKPEPALPSILESPPANPPDGVGYRIVTTGCQYCAVGCGYQAHIWSPGTGSSLPPNPEQGLWVSPAMTERVFLEGQERLAAVVPDPKCPLNRGNHSPRGGTQGRDLVGPPPTGSGSPPERDSVRERVTSAYVRTQKGENGFEPIATEAALRVVARLVALATNAKNLPNEKTVRFQNPTGLGVKLFEYQYLENTYVATKLFFQLIGTPNVAFHDRPSVASNTQGFEDSGIDPHGYAYEDIWSSDVLFLIGNNPYESQSVFFMQAMAGKRLIVLDPRRTITADYAVKTGGLHLQPTRLGADLAVLNGLCRYIRDMRRSTAAEPDPRKRWSRDWNPGNLFKDMFGGGGFDMDEGPRKPRQANFQFGPADFEGWLDTQPTLADAATLSGIPLADLKRAAQWLSGPPERDGDKPSLTRKVSTIFEKGIIWGFSYHTTAAVANLGLFLGSVLRPGPDDQPQPASSVGVTGRAGGHQKGWCEVRYNLLKKPPNGGGERGFLKDVGYPFYRSTDAFVGPNQTTWRTHHYLDAHVVGSDVAKLHPNAVSAKIPDVKLLWVVGSNAVGQVGNAQAKWHEIERRRGALSPASADEDEIVQVLSDRMESGGLVVVQQDIYPNPTTTHADIVLPASGWGEHDFTRYNGERRLRVYGKFQDAPRHGSEPVTRCLADWEVFSQVARLLLPEGWSGNGLPDGWEFANGDKSSARLLTHADFDWPNSVAVFDELRLPSRSNRSQFLEKLEPLPGQEPAWTQLRNLGSTGVVLPAARDKNSGLLIDSPRLKVKERSYAFLRADWRDIEPHFEALVPRSGEVAICNGRINELWNSLFTHIRNETVRQRFPDDMPGTILEISDEDARKFGVENGDVVELSCDDIHLGGRRGAFLAVTVVQPGALRQGVVFTYFSWPAHTRRLERFPYREFVTSGYVNNLTTGWTDPVNPIAAVKFARGKIARTGQRYPTAEPSRYAGPSFRPRSVAFDRVMLSDENERISWKMRELVVQLGLPMAVVHANATSHSATVVQWLRQPDGFLETFGGNDATSKELRGRFIDAVEGDAMQWDYTLPDGSPRSLVWTDKQKALAREWVDHIDKRSPPAPVHTP
jgi:arsenite oxidase large subunit